MKTHQMNLQPRFFDYLKNGTKRIELRLYDEKRRQIELGDEIEFATSETETIETKVIGLLRYDSFENLLRDFDVSILADASMTKEELLETLEKLYSPEEQKRHGVIGIRLEAMGPELDQRLWDLHTLT